MFVCAIIFLSSSCSSFDFGIKVTEGKIIYLNDTICANQSHNTGITNHGKYELDLDNDKNIDITFLVENHSLGRESYYISKIILQNNYSLFTEIGTKLKHSENYNYPESNSDKTEEVAIPKIFSLSDTISNNYSISNDTTTLAYKYHNAYTSYSWSYEIGQWVGIGEKYIGLYNPAQKLLSWILIELPQADKVFIKSYYYEKKQEAIIIE